MTDERKIGRKMIEGIEAHPGILARMPDFMKFMLKGAFICAIEHRAGEMDIAAIGDRVIEPIRYTTATPMQSDINRAS